MYLPKCGYSGTYFQLQDEYLNSYFSSLIFICLSVSCSQIEDLSQQVHKAAAEKFKVPLDPSPLPSDVTPSLTIKEESEEEEEV